MTATRLVRITCDGPICRPTPPPDGLAARFGNGSFGSLGGGYVILPNAPLEQLRRTIAARFGWLYDKATRRDLCPACQASSDPAPQPVAAGHATG